MSAQAHRALCIKLGNLQSPAVLQSPATPQSPPLGASTHQGIHLLLGDFLQHPPIYFSAPSIGGDSHGRGQTALDIDFSVFFM